MAKIISRIFIVLTFNSTLMFGQASKLDSLKHILDSPSIPDTTKAIVYSKCAYSFFRINPDSAMFYAQKGLELSNKISFIKGAARNNRMLGISHRIKGNIDSSFQYLKKSEKLAAKIDYYRGISACNNEYANLHNLKGEFDQALKYYLKGLEIDKNYGFNYPAAVKCKNIGLIYSQNNMHEKALSYFDEAIKLSTKVGRLEIATSAISSKGGSLNALGNHLEALQSLWLSRALNDDLSIQCLNTYTFLELSYAHLGLGNLDSAKIYSQKTLGNSTECFSVRYEVGFTLNRAKILAIEGHKQLAINELIRAYTSAKQNNLQVLENQIAQRLYILYDEASEPHSEDSAYLYLKKYAHTNDSIFNENTFQNMAMIEVAFEMEQFKREKTAQAKLEKLKQDNALLQEIWLRNTSLVGVILSVFIIYLISKAVQRKKRDYRALKSLNDEVIAQKAVLSEQAQEMKLLNHSLNEMNSNLEEKILARTKELQNKHIQLAEYAYFNAHELRAPVANILGLVDLFGKQNQSQQESDELVQLIKLSSRKLDEKVKEIQVLLDESDMRKFM